MSMSRKDYRAIADVIAGEVATAPTTDDARRQATLRTLRNVMLSTADVMARDNARFNRARFYTACGFESDGSRVREELIPLTTNDDAATYGDYSCHHCGLPGGH